MDERRERVYAQAVRIEALLGLPEETIGTYDNYLILTPDQVDALLARIEASSE